MKRPFSLTLYSVLIWLTKLAMIAGNLYFIKYVMDHKDFYLGIGLHTTMPQQYILLAGSFIVLVGTVGIFRMKKSGWKIYLAGKFVEVIALFWAYPSWSGAFTHALYGINSRAFSIVFLLMLICLTLIFPLAYYTYSRKLR
jgi:hypothetical protein